MNDEYLKTKAHEIFNEIKSVADNYFTDDEIEYRIYLLLKEIK